MAAALRLGRRCLNARCADSETGAGSLAPTSQSSRRQLLQHAQMFSDFSPVLLWDCVQ